MLAQNFMKPEALGISESETAALIRVLGMLERGEIGEQHFDMSFYQSHCGTIGCICGWANFVSKGKAFPELTKFNSNHLEATEAFERRLTRETLDLFMINTCLGPSGVGPEHAAT